MTDYRCVEIKNLSEAFWTTVAANEGRIYMVSQYPETLRTADVRLLESLICLTLSQYVCGLLNAWVQQQACCKHLSA